MDKNKTDSPENYMNDNPDYNEELEENLYLLALQKRLASMKKDRKKAEQDALLLNNRLNLLKGEEDKVIHYFKMKLLIDMEKSRSNT